MSNLWRLAGLAAGSVALAGCLVGPRYETPTIEMPTQWQAQQEPTILGAPADLRAWWSVFNDPALDALIERAVAQNLTLDAAGVRIQRARVGRRLAIFTLLPVDRISASAAHLNLSQNVKPDVEISRSGREGFSRRLGQILGQQLGQNVQLPDVSVRDELDRFDVGFDAMWELDLWGQRRHSIRAANDVIEATVADYDDVLVSLTGEVAASYLQIRTLQQRQQLTEANIASLEYASAHASSELGASLLQTLLADTRATLPALEAAQQQTSNSLCVLLGEPPQRLADLLGGPGEIPAAPAGVAMGVPADLLRRRPDIRALERRVAAQCEQIGRREAMAYPSLSLLGGLGLTSSNIDTLFESGSFRWAYGGAVKWSLLLIPAFRDLARIEDAEFQSLLLEYEQAIYQAAAEAENAAVAFSSSNTQLTPRAESAAAARHSVDLALASGDAASVRLAYSDFVSQQDLLLQTQSDAAMNLVALYKALGGGWQIREGRPFISPDTLREMQERTNWGPYLTPETTGVPTTASQEAQP